MPHPASLASLLLLLLAPLAHGQATPSGLWRSIDDATGKPQALVRVAETSGELSGKIEKLFPGVSEDPNPLCVKCSGARKNQPVLGMTILWGLKPEKNSAEAAYSGGEILDPDNGTTYRALLTLVDNGRKLNVRGYVGVSLFGRTQVWERVE